MEASCFACGGMPPALERESAHRWLVPRQACAAHVAACRLEDGTPLSAVLEQPWPEELEGAGANLLLNPLRLGEGRAWLDVTSRGRAVLEELFPSADYFEFSALHLPSFVEVLFDVRDLAHFAHREPLGMMAALGVDNARYTSLQALLGLWSCSHGLQTLMAQAAIPRPRTLREAADLWTQGRCRLPMADPGPDHLRLFLMALLALASRRFVHVGATARPERI